MERQQATSISNTNKPTSAKKDSRSSESDSLDEKAEKPAVKPAPVKAERAEAMTAEESAQAAKPVLNQSRKESPLESTSPKKKSVPVAKKKALILTVQKKRLRLRSHELLINQ